jgi:hypothetical protein
MKSAVKFLLTRSPINTPSFIILLKWSTLDGRRIKRSLGRHQHISKLSHEGRIILTDFEIGRIWSKMEKTMTLRQLTAI